MKMDLSFIANWVNTVFADFDYAILSFMHILAQSVGVVLTPVMKIITLVGEKGIIILLLAVILICFSKTRKAGVCMIVAVLCSAVITSLILKEAIRRPRPFEVVYDFGVWWEYVGSPFESGFSFPSGHVTAAMAGAVALCLELGKKYILPSAAFVLAMGVSRNYLMAHYPSDVLAGMLAGTIAAVIAYLLVKLAYSYINKRTGKLSNFILDFDLRDYYAKLKKKDSNY